jgi:5-formyltetrahydrofolate cyclo-ligase
MNEIIYKKKKLRKILAQKRDLIKKNSSIEFNSKFFNKLIKNINFADIKFVASFMSIRSEISTDQLNKKIIKLKKYLSFPVIKRNSQELIFKQFNSYENLKLGKFNIPEPTNKNNEVIPQLFFVPCLGFDLNGYRLGYGGGYYDKTFDKLKRLNHKFYTVGFAFDDQKQNEIPVENFDYKLDFVLTEKQLYKFL